MIEIDDEGRTVSIDRVKPAFMVRTSYEESDNRLPSIPTQPIRRQQPVRTVRFAKRYTNNK